MVFEFKRIEVLAAISNKKYKVCNLKGYRVLITSFKAKATEDYFFLNL